MTKNNPLSKTLDFGRTKGPKIYRTIYNHTREPEKVSSESQTIPDDSFTIAELFRRNQIGAPVPVLARPVTWTEDPKHSDIDMSAITRMDLVDLTATRERLSAHVEKINARRAELEQQRLDELEKAKNDDLTTKKADSEPSKP